MVHWVGLLIPLLLAIVAFKAGIRLRKWTLSGGLQSADESFMSANNVLKLLVSLIYIILFLLATVLAAFPLILVGSEAFPGT